MEREIAMQTTDSVRSVKGVGEKAEQNLHKLKN